MKHCLIIDDEDQQAKIDAEVLKQNAQFPIKYSFFSLDSRELIREEKTPNGPEFVLDFEKVISHLRAKFGNEKIDIIACDYVYNGLKTDGLRLIRYLKEEKFRGKRLPYILYSSKWEEIEERLQAEVKQFINDKRELKNYLESYFESKPEKISERTNYFAEITEYLRRNRTDLSLRLDAELRKYPEKKFDNLFPRFKDKTLIDLANLLNRSSDEGDDFESEFFERCVAHFIHLKE